MVPELPLLQGLVLIVVAGYLDDMRRQLLENITGLCYMLVPWGDIISLDCGNWSFTRLGN
jgi:hypothetical protein